MKKNVTKKLVLAKETVLNLGLRTGHLAGGITPSDNCATIAGCPYTAAFTCGGVGLSAGPAICVNELPTYACP